MEKVVYSHNKILVNKDEHRISKSILMRSIVVVYLASDCLDLGISDTRFHD